MWTIHRDDVHPRQHLVEALPVGRAQFVGDARRHRTAVVVMNLQAECPCPARQGLADAAHADNAEAFSPDAVAEHPGRRPARPVLALGEDGSAFDSRRGTARISAMVISAVSSVRTFGVLVTVMPRAWAAVTSILSTPLPKLAISFSLQSGCLSTSSLISSVTVGTSTSAERTASAICSGVSGVSSRLSRASNSSRIRVSIESGSLRVTTTRGFFLTVMFSSRKVFQTSLTRLFDTAFTVQSRRLLRVSRVPRFFPLALRQGAS